MTHSKALSVSDIPNLRNLKRAQRVLLVACGPADIERLTQSPGQPVRLAMT